MQIFSKYFLQVYCQKIFGINLIKYLSFNQFDQIPLIWSNSSHVLNQFDQIARIYLKSIWLNSSHILNQIDLISSNSLHILKQFDQIPLPLSSGPSQWPPSYAASSPAGKIKRRNGKSRRRRTWPRWGTLRARWARNFAFVWEKALISDHHWIIMDENR